MWDIKARLGLLSTASHMAYADFASGRRRARPITPWEVVCSGFFDSVGLYEPVGLEHARVARVEVARLGLRDLVAAPAPPAPSGGAAAGRDGAARARRARGGASFGELSYGEQRLVLLCRAVVKTPRLLLLDEPTHGLSGLSRARLLAATRALADDDDVAVVYVTHRRDEADARVRPRARAREPGGAERATDSR